MIPYENVECAASTLGNRINILKSVSSINNYFFASGVSSPRLVKESLNHASILTSEVAEMFIPIGAGSSNPL